MNKEKPVARFYEDVKFEPLTSIYRKELFEAMRRKIEDDVLNVLGGRRVGLPIKWEQEELR